MRILLLAGASLLTLASPALARQEPPPAEAADTQLDTLEPADEAPAQAAVQPTGDPVLDRLNALEARVNQLETENARLKQQAELS